MQKSLWYFSTWAYENYKIIEAQVIKETEKQFVVIANTNGCEYTVRKGEMKSCGRCFYTSEEQARQGLIDFLKRDISIYKMSIEMSQKEINKRKAILKERFNVEVE